MTSGSRAGAKPNGQLVGEWGDGDDLVVPVVLSREFKEGLRLVSVEPSVAEELVENDDGSVDDPVRQAGKHVDRARVKVAVDVDEAHISSDRFLERGGVSAKRPT